MAREAKFYMAIGGKGIGKTFTTTRVINNSVRGTRTSAPRKALIFDVNNEYEMYRPIECTEKNILLFVKQKKIEARRVLPIQGGMVKSPEQLRVDMDIILKYFMEGLLVLEDLALIVGDSVATSIVGALSTLRHRDVDIIMHFQSIAKFAHPKFKPLKNVLRLHKATDSSSRARVKDNLGDDFPLVRIAEIIVNNRYLYGIRGMNSVQEKSGKWNVYDIKFRRFYCYVDFDNQKIFGGFTKQEYDDAVLHYLQEESTEEISPLLKLKDIETGKARYTYKEALDERILNYSFFYGNKS